MTVTVQGDTFVASGSATVQELHTTVAANPTLAMSTPGAVAMRSSNMRIDAGSVFTVDDGSMLAFGSVYGYRLNLNGTIVFKNGGGIVYNGNVQHSFFNGKINGTNAVYRLNATVAGGRQDFFSPSTSSDGLKNFTFVYGGGASGANYYTHLENFGGKFDGLTFVNDVTSSLGAGAISIQLDGGTYKNVTFPRTTSAAGITSTVQIWLPRNSNKTTVLESPVMPESVLTVVGDCTNGAADLINETWPDLPEGTVGSLAVGSRNIGETIVSRKIIWTPGSYVGWAVRLTDSQATPTVYNAGAIASAAGINLTWAKWARSTQVQTLLGPFKITARKPGFKERTGIAFSPVQPLTEAFLPEADPYYTQDQTALAGINADAATKTITTTAALTLDKINDWFDGWLALPAQLASVPVTPKSHSAKTMVLGGGWALAGAQFAAPGAKIADFVDAKNAGFLPAKGADDTDTVRVRRASDDTVLMQRTGSGAMPIKPADVGVQVYVQRVSAAGRVRGETDALVLAAGANAAVPLFFGADVQVADVAGLAKLSDLAALAKTTDLAPLATAAAVTALGTPAQAAALTALAATNQTEHDATQAAIAALPAGVTVAQIRADIERTGGMLDTVPTLPEMLASTLAKQADLTNAQTAIVGEINANKAKIDAVKADTAAINAKTATLINAPTKEQIRAEMEIAGSKLDKAMKAAQSAEDQTV